MKASRSPPPGSPQGCSRACSAPSKQRPGSGASKMTLLGECPCQRGPRTCPIPPPRGRVSVHCLGIAHTVPKLGFGLVFLWLEGTPGPRRRPHSHFVSLPHLHRRHIFHLLPDFFPSTSFLLLFDLPCKSRSPSCLKVFHGPAPVHRKHVAPGPSPGLHFRLCHVGAWGNPQHILLKPPLFTGKREDGEKPCRWACWSLRDPGHGQPTSCILPDRTWNMLCTWLSPGERGPIALCAGFRGPVPGAATRRSWRAGCHAGMVTGPQEASPD